MRTLCLRAVSLGGPERAARRSTRAREARVVLSSTKQARLDGRVAHSPLGRAPVVPAQVRHTLAYARPSRRDGVVRAGTSLSSISRASPDRAHVVLPQGFTP